jgi:hypothetical protein
MMDLLLKANAANDRLEAEKEAARAELQRSLERNRALETELEQTRRLLREAERAREVSRCW